MGASVISVILPIKRSPSVPGGRSSENVGETVAAEGQGGQSAIDRDDALSFTPEELEQMDSTEGETDEGMEKLGEVYYDAETGKYYIIENGN